MKFVQFGAGNIGRSFVAQLFSRAGFEVVFIDVVDEIVSALNQRGQYVVQIKDREPQQILVRNVRAVNGRDTRAVAEELASCRLCATAIGPKALPAIQATLAGGAQLRAERGLEPLDVILCENLRDSAHFMWDGIQAHLPEGMTVADTMGLIETSIGKMVPIMPDEVRQSDPLLVYAEAYNTLICDKKGFKNPVPDVPGLDPKDNMIAYVDRKSFVHNFGHALCAYFAFLQDPRLLYTWQAVEHSTVGPATRQGMWESARALIAQYPGELDEHGMDEHIEDLLSRFCNRALGDTIYRVGRDVTRKLGREDRVIGALRLQVGHGQPGPITALCAAAGMRFLATDEKGEPFPADAQFARQVLPKGVEHVLRTVCGLEPEDEVDRGAYEAVLEADAALQSRLQAGGSIFG